MSIFETARWRMPARFIVGPCDVKPFSIELTRCDVTEDINGRTVLNLVARVLDRETGYPVDVSKVDQVPHEVLNSHASMVWGEWVRARLGELLAHELAENILVDGRRAFDPHAPQQFPQHLLSVKL